MTSAGGALALLSILAAAAVLRAAFFTGYNGYDDVRYIQRAFELANGDLTPPGSYFEARIGLVAPTALLYRCFPVTPLSTVAFPFACSLLSVVLGYSLGRRLYGRSSALLAASLMACFPMEVLFASKLYATAPVTLLCGFAFGCFVLAERKGRAGLYFASGLGLGLAGLLHEPALMALAFFPIYVLTAGRVRIQHGLVAAGVVLGLALDPLIHALLGDAWARVVLLGHAQTVRGINEDVGYSGLNAAWLAEPLVRVFFERTFGLYPWLLVPVALYRGWRPRDGSDRPLVLIVATGFLWIEYGTVSPLDYAPLAREPRYLAPIVMPAVWLLAAELARWRRGARIAALGALTASSVGFSLLDSGSPLEPYQDLEAFLDRIRPAEVVVEPGARFPLAFAAGLRPSYTLSTLGESEPEDALVVVFSDSGVERMEARPGAARIAEFPRSDKLYHELLRAEPVQRILRATRPAARYETYAGKADPWRLVVFRVP